MKVTGIILASGKSERFGKNTEKQFMTLTGKPITNYSLDVFESVPEITDYIIVTNKNRFKLIENKILKLNKYTKFKNIIEGGRLRANSVMNALNSLKDSNPDIVLIHDSARPLIEFELVREIIKGAVEYKSCIPGISVTDTIKICGRDNMVESTPDRQYLFAVQTPQGFKYKTILNAYLRGMTEGFEGTDDASFVERLGEKVKVIPGLKNNIKITYPEDIGIAKLFLKGRKHEE